MGLQKPLINLSGAMDLIKRSKNPLAPIYEAITNSLESLAQKGSVTEASHNIELAVYFGGLLNDKKEIQKIKIIDNGAGFNKKNYERFIEFFDKSKGYDNRGTGRLQYFHRFDQLKVDSVFDEGERTFCRSIHCNKSNFITDEELKEIVPSPSLTTISLSEFSGGDSEQEFFNSLSIDELTNYIKSHFLLRFYLDNKKEHLQAPELKLTFFKAGELIGERVIKPADMPLPKEEGEISVPFMKATKVNNDEVDLDVVVGKLAIIKWAHFVIPDTNLDRNSIYLCSKDIPVQSLSFRHLKKHDSIKGNRYLTAFYGEVLDKPENVNDSVDSFKFPEKKEVKSIANDLFFDPTTEFLFMDSIQENVEGALPHIYKDVIDIQEVQQKDIESIARAHGISSELVKKTKINFGDDEQTITRKLYTTQSSELADKSYRAKKIFESLSTLSPTSDDYQSEIQNKTEALSNLVDEQNKDELSRYIIRREMVADILRRILSNELDCQNVPSVKGIKRDKEGLIHDLIFKRKNKSSKSLNDLWILNEEFMHFDGCSDLPLNQIETSNGSKLLRDIPQHEVDSLGLKITRRPDIFLYPGEEKCLLIELKQQDEDLTDHLNQMSKYCTLIANYSDKKISRFYCYLIGENINPLDLDGEYKPTVNGDWIRSSISIVTADINRNTIGSAQIEILKLSSIFTRAHKRNLSFAEKLGLPSLLDNLSNKSP